MFDDAPPLTPDALGTLSAGARLYLRPTALVERPHGLDGRCLRIADTLVWFAAFAVTVRDGGVKREALVPVEQWAEWSARLPDALAAQAAAQVAALSAPRAPLRMGERVVRLNEPQVMGILNVTPDSFSDGGRHGDDAERAADAGFAMASAGAAIVDVGGESTRLGAPLVWERDEIARVVPVIERLARGGVAVSVDTRKAAVMEAALAAGAGMINDISALLYDDRAMEVARAASCPVVLMHAPSQTSDPHAGGDYADVLFDVYDWLSARVAAVEAAGIDRSRIVIDPGIGFGKGVGDNLALLNGLSLFHTLGVPVLFGASRKRFIGALDGEAAADARLGGSIAAHVLAVGAGAQLVRVHDVPETRQALRLWRGLRDRALTG